MTSSADSAAPSPVKKNTVSWQAVGTGGLDELATARAETVNLMQWLARVANSYVRNGAAEQRTELEFRASQAAFVTRPFDNNVALELRLPSLEMQFLEHDAPAPHVLDPEEHSPAEVEAWILVELLHRGIDREKFSTRLPYPMADLMSGDAEDHSPRSCRRGLEELAAWLKNAAAVLEAAAHAAGARDARIVCLPQTFTLTCMSGLEGKPADFGFSPGDSSEPEPFFFATAVAAEAAGAAGTRMTLKASKLLAQQDPAAAATAFLKSAFA
jgi:hypothetical protein